MVGIAAGRFHDNVAREKDLVMRAKHYVQLPDMKELSVSPRCRFCECWDAENRAKQPFGACHAALPVIIPDAMAIEPGMPANLTAMALRGKWPITGANDKCFEGFSPISGEEIAELKGLVPGGESEPEVKQPEESEPAAGKNGA